ncbi:MAG: PTS fructose transporter subunit IIB [Elusimicrobia bacterium CG11_big_fil_rev_8_21_14_0_20_64_6]|nr:MAG: PTS fructose transporter subunit IIB [Elusimicrobia bacterium CG11_big_fil_rev_8_21_14_0_20_64_6]
MAITLLRVDDRLIHGQVVEGWVPFLKVDLVLVVSDAAAADDIQAALMKMALPPAVGLLVLPVADAAKTLNSPKMAVRKALVLVPGPSEALALVEKGVKVERINVGGLHYTVGKVQLGRALFLDEKDRLALRALAAKGIRLEGRALPGDAEEDLAAALEGK